MTTEITALSKFTKCRMLFWGFFKIAALVVGGGYAIVPAAENEFIHRKKLLTEDELLDMMAIIQSLPGIIAGNAALYIGYRAAGVWGALTALLGVATPSTVIILLIAIFLQNIDLNIPVTEQGPGYGSVILAMVGAGEFDDVKTATDKFFEIKETVIPDKELSALYANRYEKYRKIYPAVKELYKEIKE